MKSNTLNFIKLSIFFLSTLLFFSCSQFSNPSTGSISFSIDSRAARDAKEEAGIDFPVMINIQLHGDYEAVKEEQFPDEPKELVFSFGDLPVGTKIYATAEIYTNISYQKDEKAEPFTEKIIFWESKSDPITVAKGENTINLYFGMPEPIEENKNDEKESKSDENEYVDETPVLKANGQAEVEKGTAVVTYRSKEKSVHPEGDGWAAGYWEFSNLIDYNKAYITLRAKTPDGGTPTPYGYRFCIKGLSPYYANESGQDRHSTANQYFNLEDSSDSITIAVNIQKLCTFRDSDFGDIHFAPTALEFENCSYEGSWDDSGDTNVIWGNDWSLEIEEIRLVQIPLMPEIVIFDPDNEETINNITIQNGTTPTAPAIETVTRREHTYLKVTPNGYNLGITLPREIDLTDYIYVKAQVYSENDSEEEQIGLALRLITPENENLTDQHRRISDDFFTETCSNKIVTMTGNLINGTQIVNHLTAFVLNKASGEAQSDKAIYIGKIIATTSMSSDFDLYQTAETEITISIEPVEESSDFEVNFSDITTDAGTIGKTLTAPASFESYEWKLNGQTLPDATSNIVDIPYDLLNIGHNRISLFVTREGEAFSWNATIDKAYD